MRRIMRGFGDGRFGGPCSIADGAAPLQFRCLLASRARGAASVPRVSRASRRQAVPCQAEEPAPSASGSTDATADAAPAPAPALARSTRARVPRKATTAAAASSLPAAQPDALLTPAPAPSAPRPRRPRTKKIASSSAPVAPSPEPASSSASSSGPPTLAQPTAATTPSPRRTGPAVGGTLLIVDGNYLANRTYFGYGARGLSTSTGVPTTVTYGVLRVLQQAVRSVRPTALAVVFDNGPTFRGMMSLLDPRGPAGAVAARLVREGRLDWQDLATRLLQLTPFKSAMQAAAAADAAPPASYLPSGGTFALPYPAPAPATALANASAAAMGDQVETGLPLLPVEAHLHHQQRLRSMPFDPAEAREALAAVLGPELAAELGLVAAAEADVVQILAGTVPSYKAGRASKPDDFYVDFRNLQRLLGLMSIPPLMRPWIEADDLAGLLVQDAVQRGMAVRILSGDRDLFQLVSDPDDVALLYPLSSQPAAAAAAGGGGPSGARRRLAPDFPFSLVHEAEVVAALGVVPALVADWKALVGDSSDKLPGVSGIGPKAATQLLTSYGSLAGVHRAAEAGELPAKRRAALQDDLAASQYTLALARVLGAPGAPACPEGVLPSGLLGPDGGRLALRGFDSSLVEPALLQLELRSLARNRAVELQQDFGGAL